MLPTERTSLVLIYRQHHQEDFATGVAWAMQTIVSSCSTRRDIGTAYLHTYIVGKQYAPNHWDLATWLSVRVFNWKP